MSNNDKPKNTTSNNDLKDSNNQSLKDCTSYYKIKL